MPDANVPNDPYLQRLVSLREMVEASPRLSGQPREELTSLLSTAIEVRELFPEVLEEVNLGPGNFVQQSDAFLHRLPEIAASGDPLAALSWVRQFAMLVQGFLGFYTGPGPFGTQRDAERADFLGAIEGHLKTNDQRIAMAQELASYEARTDTLIRKVESVVADAEVARNVAEAAAGAAQEAAGTSGSASLATYFQTYAGAELRSANLFRWLTVASILGAIGVAVLLPHPANGDWAALAYRLVVVVGVAGLGTYFGRQAGQHRRVYNWAKSIQVQLQSFPAFIERVEGETRDSMYDVFARRVLGAPPEKAAGKDEDQSANLMQLIELAAAFAKRAP